MTSQPDGQPTVAATRGKGDTTTHVSRIGRSITLVTAAVLLASLATAIVAAPAAAAKKAKCQGQKATIVGTSKRDVIYGTDKRDVIAALGGNDIVIGGGGNDLVCGGTGNDRPLGVRGKDLLYGNAGDDRLVGGKGPDRMYGGVGNDVLIGRTGDDLLNGGPGIDTCFQQQGTGPERGCELPYKLIPLTGILAVAYSDVDGVVGYSTGDVLIAMLVDANGDLVPSAGDTVIMGRYPTNLDATAFGDWGVVSHAVASIDIQTATQIKMLDSGAGTFAWIRDASREAYGESPPAG